MKLIPERGLLRYVLEAYCSYWDDEINICKLFWYLVHTAFFITLMIVGGVAVGYLLMSTVAVIVTFIISSPYFLSDFALQSGIVGVMVIAVTLISGGVTYLWNKSKNAPKKETQTVLGTMYKGFKEKTCFTIKL